VALQGHARPRFPVDQSASGPHCPLSRTAGQATIVGQHPLRGDSSMKERIDGNTVRKVRHMMKDGREAKVFDEECAGLAIRTYKTGRAS
jgi:hypothetical protein